MFEAIYLAAAAATMTDRRSCRAIMRASLVRCRPVRKYTKSWITEPTGRPSGKMNFFQRNNYFVLAWIAFRLCSPRPPVTFAQTDEIQVYDAEIEDQGKFNVMVHSNFTPIGRKTPDFPGGIIPNHSVNGAVEWAYGVTDWFEQGLYFPVYTAYSQGRGGSTERLQDSRTVRAAACARSHVFLRRQFRVQRQLHVLGVQAHHFRGSAHRGIAPASGGHHFQSDCGYRLHRRFWEPRIRSGDASRLQLQ